MTTLLLLKHIKVQIQFYKKQWVIFRSAKTEPKIIHRRKEYNGVRYRANRKNKMKKEKELSK